MKFKNKITGIVEDVTNASLIPQYQKHSETYEVVKAKVDNKAKAPKTAENE